MNVAPHKLFINVNLFKYFFTTDLRKNYDLKPCQFFMFSKHMMQEFRNIQKKESHVGSGIRLVHDYLCECITNIKDETTNKYYGTNVVYPSFSTIAEITNLSSRGVIKAMDKLCEYRLIYKLPAVFSMGVHTDKKHKSNLYYVCGTFEDLEQERYIIEEYIKRMKSLLDFIRKVRRPYKEFLSNNDPLFFYLIFSLRNKYMSKEKMKELKERISKFYPNYIRAMTHEESELEQLIADLPQSDL